MTGVARPHGEKPTGSTNRERALPVGRALRLLLGLIVIAEVIPIFLRMDDRFLLGTALMIIALAAVYVFVHVLASRRLLGASAWAGSILAVTLLVAVFVAGGRPGGLLVGRGDGQLAAATILGISLLFAAVRGDPGCELMSISGALFGEHSRLACIVFSPIDWLERKLRRRELNR